MLEKLLFVIPLKFKLGKCKLKNNYFVQIFIFIFHFYLFLL